MRSRSQEEYALGLERLLMDNQRVEDLVSRMLTLARMEQAAEPRAATIELGNAVRLALDNLAPMADARSVTVTFEADPQIRVHLSSEKAEVLVSNLLVNAIQHSPRGSEVTVALRKNGDTAILLVRDTGTGISPGALPHIFERFYREDSSRSRETGGAGLGLAISKSIVQSAGGSISVESSPGVETIAKVSLRLA